MKHSERSNARQTWSAWIVALVLVGWISGCKPDETKGNVVQLTAQIPVTVRQAASVSARDIITVSGTLEADKTAPLSFLVPGKVNRVYVDEGDRVKAGTLLATLDPADYGSSLSMAEASLTRAQDAYKRYEPLYREGAFTEKNLIELKTGLAQAKAGHAMARKALADTKLHASISGIVAVKGIELGQLVSPQMVAFTLVKTDVIFARVSVPESEIGQVKPGQKADVTVPALGDRRFTGNVTMIGAKADERTRTYPVKIRLANPEGILRDGMIARTGILTDRTVNTLTVPGHAIVRDAANLTCLFVADRKKGLAQKRRVVPGGTFGHEIEIQSGITADDAVIISGQHRLDDGTPIAVSNAVIAKEVAR